MKQLRSPFGLNESLFFGSTTLAQAGQNVWLAALFIAAGTGGRPALDLSSVFVAMIIPAITLGLPGGALADRLGPARGKLVGSLLRLAPVLAAIPLFNLFGPSVWVLAFLYAAASQVYEPADIALVRGLRQRGHARIHSTLVALQYIGQGAGMLLFAPALYLLGGTSAMVFGAAALIAALCGVSAVLAWRLRDVRDVAPVSSRNAINFRQTLRFFASEQLARYAVVTLGLKMIVSRSIVVALPVYLATVLNIGALGFSLLILPGIAGLVAGLLITGSRTTLQSAYGMMRWSIAGLAVALAAVAALDLGIAAAATYSQIAPLAQLESATNMAIVVAVPVAFLIGLGLAGTHVPPRVALTESAPVGQQARVFAVQLTITEAVLLIPLVLAGVGTTFLGARIMFGVLAAAALFAFAVIELDRWRTSRKPVHVVLPDAMAVQAPTPERPSA